MTAILVAEGVAIVLLAVLVVGLLRSHAEILRSLHDLGVRTDAAHPSSAFTPSPARRTDAPPDIAGQSLSGSAVHVGVAGARGRTLLTFLSSGCSSCLVLWQGLREGDPVSDLDDTRLVVVTKGPEAESQSKLEELAPKGVTVVQSTEAWEAYSVPVTPYFVLVDGASGEVVGEGAASSWEQVNSLILQATGDRDAVRRGAEPEAEAELRSAGIGPGHPSLYPGQHTPEVDDE